MRKPPGYNVALELLTCLSVHPKPIKELLDAVEVIDVVEIKEHLKSLRKYNINTLYTYDQGLQVSVSPKSWDKAKLIADAYWKRVYGMAA